MNDRITGKHPALGAPYGRDQATDAALHREEEANALFDASRYGETDKSAVTHQEVALFNEQEAKIAAMIVEMLGCPSTSVTRTATLESLGADSLDGIELAMEAEERFHCEISDEEMEKIVTVADLFAVLATATAHEADAVIRPVDGGDERWGRPLDSIRENPDAE